MDLALSRSTTSALSSFTLSSPKRQFSRALASASNRISESELIWVPLHNSQLHRSDRRGESDRKLSIIETQSFHLADASWSFDPSKRVIHPLLTCKTPQCCLGLLMGTNMDVTLVRSSRFELELRR